MIVLDTNIISEAWRLNPDPAVMAWLNAHHELSPAALHALVVLETLDSK